MMPDYRHYAGATVLVHSAKGSTWENHKYIKRVDGTYYYPNDYKGGRHIKDLNDSDSESNVDTTPFDELEAHAMRLMEQGEAYWDTDYSDLSRKDNVLNYDRDDLADLYEDITGIKLSEADKDHLYRSMQAKRKQVESKNNDASDKVEDWERRLYDDIDNVLEINPGLFDPADIVNLQDFEITLGEFAGVDTENLSKEEIERMRQKVIDHYADMQSARTLSEDDIANLAQEVIKGNFGNGAQRRELLGSNYQEVQDRVNQILRTQGNRTIDDSSKKEEEKKTTKKSTSSSSNAKALDVEKVMGVYRREDDAKKKAKKAVNKKNKGK